VENYRLEEVWSVEDNGAEPFLFGIIEDVLIDESGTVFALDSQVKDVKVFSAEGDYLQTFGGEGEGPGEFRAPASLTIMPDGSLGIVSNVIARIVKLDRETGHPRNSVFGQGQDGGPTFFGKIKSHPSFSPDGFVAVVKEMKVSSWKGKPDFWNGRLYLASFAEMPLGEDTYPLTIFAEIGRMAGSIEEEEEYYWLWRPWTIDSLGRVVMAPSWGKYQLQYFDPKGKMVQNISFPFDHRSRMDQEEKRALNFLCGGIDPEIMGVNLILSDTEAVIREIIPRENGVVWVWTNQSGKNNPPGVLLELDAISSTGDLQGKVKILGKGDPDLDRLFFGPKDRVVQLRNGEGFILNARGRIPTDDVYDLVLVGYDLVKEK
jgi:hypothetical protein